jgi:uncharacterized lipoprotein YbaY
MKSILEESMSLKWIIPFLALGTFLFSGCSPQKAAVTGTVTYRERIALPDDAQVQVRLLDTSRQDVAADVLGEQIILTEGRQVPIPFEVEYNESDIQSNHTYQIGVRITDGSGKLLFISTTATPVITRGAPTEDVEVIVEQVN